jgi:SAM-dependent methyltransferase
MRFVKCDLCDSPEVAVLFTHRDVRPSTAVHSFQVVECRGCGLAYLNPRPEGLELAVYYPEAYYDGLEPDGGGARRSAASLRDIGKKARRALLQRFYQYPTPDGGLRGTGTGLVGLLKTAGLQLERWRLRIGGREAAIIPFLGEGRLLDVGCAGGRDLELLKEMGWNVTGVELSPSAASVARARLGCEVFVGDFEQVPLGAESFDVVRFSHTLEHLPSPRRALEKAHRILRPFGLLWIEVPNAASLERRLFGKHWYCWDLPRHLYHFTPKSLARLVSSAGFRPVKIKCDGRTFFFTESVANAWKSCLRVPLPRTKFLSAMARPLVYALSAMNRGGVLTVHARKDRPGGVGFPGGSLGERSDGTTP